MSEYWGIVARAPSGSTAAMTEAETKKTLQEHVADLVAERTQCNCDLDNWEPTRETGHSHACRIHKSAHARLRAQSR